jgi:hypothetical protein
MKYLPYSALKCAVMFGAADSKKASEQRSKDLEDFQDSAHSQDHPHPESCQSGRVSVSDSTSLVFKYNMPSNSRTCIGEVHRIHRLRC